MSFILGNGDNSFEVRRPGGLGKRSLLTKYEARHIREGVVPRLTGYGAEDVPGAMKAGRAVRSVLGSVYPTLRTRNKEKKR